MMDLDLWKLKFGLLVKDIVVGVDGWGWRVGGLDNGMACSC